MNNDNNDINEIVFRGILSVLESSGHNWTGTMTNLKSSLNRVLSKKQRPLLPRSPSSLRMTVNKVLNRLRNNGLSVRFSRAADRTRTRYVKFTR